MTRSTRNVMMVSQCTTYEESVRMNNSVMKRSLEKASSLISSYIATVVWIRMSMMSASLPNPSTNKYPSPRMQWFHNPILFVMIYPMYVVMRSKAHYRIWLYAP